MITLKTSSGACYIIDSEKKTWKRIKGPNSATIRSDEGEFIWHSKIEIGQSICFLCPGIDPAFAERAIYTTPVVEILLIC